MKIVADPAVNQLTDDVKKIKEVLDRADIPEDLKFKTDQMVQRLVRQAEHGSYAEDFEMVRHYVDWVTNLPWKATTEDILDLAKIRETLDKSHFGLDSLKDRFLEYIAMMILNKTQENPQFRAPILLLVGLVGTGKTTIAYSIAEALGRKFVRIPFGGMSSALDLRGKSMLHIESEPGHIIKGLRQAGSNNPVVLLDEIDRVAESARGEIMGVLVELLDPAQNNSFVDHYLDYPFDLSQALFIATCNNTTHISTAVMDRLEPITMPSYTDEEKIHIAREYILPKQIRKAALPEGAVTISDEMWPKVVRPLGYDAGIRTLERTIEGIVRKVAKMIVEKKGEKFVLDETNIKQFLPTY